MAESFDLTHLREGRRVINLVKFDLRKSEEEGTGRITPLRFLILFPSEREEDTAHSSHNWLQHMHSIDLLLKNHALCLFASEMALETRKLVVSQLGGKLVSNESHVSSSSSELSKEKKLSFC